MIEAIGNGEVVDAAVIGDEARVAGHDERPFAVADDELKGAKHLAQGALCIVVFPGENAFCGIAPGDEKDLRFRCVRMTQRSLDVEKQPV